MNSLFDDLRQGAQEILEFEQGHRKLRIDRICIEPVEVFTASDIRQLRSSLNLSQRSFASVIGVSNKTVEAWESGNNKPAGATSRLLKLLKEQPVLAQKFYSCSLQKSLN